MGQRLTIALGAVLLIVAVARFVIVPEHAPVPPQCVRGQACLTGDDPASYVAHGDVLRIATWAALIVGVLAVIVGLIGYARSYPQRSRA
jgi:hypothetical protein